MRWSFRPSGRWWTRQWLSLAVVVLLQAQLARVAAQTSGRQASFYPKAIPLAVRTPYLSAWLFGDKRTLNGGWAAFSDANRILGWAGFAMVDGVAYLTMGDPAMRTTGKPSETAEQTGFYMTATSTVFTLLAGPVSLTYTFLSPITPNDLIRQSIPFAYLSVQAASRDGLPHNVSIYSEMSGEWLSSDTGQPMTWSTVNNGGTVIHKLELQSLQPLKETADRILDGAAYHVSSGHGLTFQSGRDQTLRSQFLANGTLLNTQDTQFRAINDSWPVFAFCKDIGAVLFNSDIAVFAIGHVRDDVVKLTLASGAQAMQPYFRSKYADDDDLLSFVINDFTDVTRISSDFDARVESGAADLSEANVDYPTLLYLSARQSLGATELTTSGSGRPMLFVKDMYYTRTINAVDAVYAMWPLLRYTSPQLAMAALEPILAYQSAAGGSSTCRHDLGVYPVADGYSNGSISSIPVAASSSLLIMALDAARATGDKSQLSDYSQLLGGWASYLVEHALYPDSSNQFALDEFAGGLINQTNVALQGILGIGAMSEIASLTGDDQMSKKYADTARDLAAQWELNAMSPNGTGSPHLLLTYGDESSWSLAYNLYVDKLLGLGLISQSIYDSQESYYASVREQRGLPLDSRGPLAITEWTIWAAAVTNSTAIKEQLVGSVRNYVAKIPGDGVPFRDVYDVSTASAGDSIRKARPHVGGNFAILALKDANVTSTSPLASQSSSPGLNSALSPALVLSCFLVSVTSLYLIW